MPLPMFGQEYPHQLCNLAYIQEILEGLHLDSLTTYKMSDMEFEDLKKEMAVELSESEGEVLPGSEPGFAAWVPRTA